MRWPTPNEHGVYVNCPGTEEILLEGKDVYLQIKLLQVDQHIWISAYREDIGRGDNRSGSGCGLSRKWGEYPTRVQALLAITNRFVQRSRNNTNRANQQVLNRLVKMIQDLLKQQLREI